VLDVCMWVVYDDDDDVYRCVDRTVRRRIELRRCVGADFTRNSASRWRFVCVLPRVGLSTYAAISIVDISPIYLFTPPTSVSTSTLPYFTHELASHPTKKGTQVRAGRRGPRHPDISQHEGDTEEDMFFSSAVFDPIGSDGL
jgi:hypothetical protein